MTNCFHRSTVARGRAIAGLCHNILFVVCMWCLYAYFDLDILVGAQSVIIWFGIWWTAVIDNVFA